MELDDFRRQWQQPAADAPATLNAEALAQLLAKAGRSPIDEIRRNAWWELGFTVILLIVSVIMLFYVASDSLRTMLGLLILVCLVSIFSYHRRMLRGIQSLSQLSITMHAHIAQRVADVRQTMALSYRSVIWVVFITQGISLLFSLQYILTTYSGRRLLVQVGWVVVGAGVGGLISYFAIRFFARRALQDLYGRHLDRLEAALRELGADEAA